MALVGTSPSSYPRILGTAFSPLSPLPVVRCTFLSPRSLSLSLPLERGQEEDKSDAACACVCKCPRVCLFPSFALIPGCGQPVAQDGRLYLGEENCLPVALPPPLSLCCVQRKKVWTSFYLLFCLLFDSHFTIAIQGRDANIFPALSYSGMLSPVFWASCFVV